MGPQMAQKPGESSGSRNRSARGRTTAPGPLRYQSLCRYIVEYSGRDRGWQPYDGDGIDVPINLKGTIVTFDIALISPNRDRILVGECKAWATRLEQDHIFTLFGKIT